jgi:hypothetical protein
MGQWWWWVTSSVFFIPLGLEAGSKLEARLQNLDGRLFVKEADRKSSEGGTIF